MLVDLPQFSSGVAPRPSASSVSPSRTVRRFCTRCCSSGLRPRNSIRCTVAVSWTGGGGGWARAVERHACPCPRSSAGSSDDGRRRWRRWRCLCCCHGRSLSEVNRRVNQRRRGSIRRVVPLEHARQRRLAQFLGPAQHARIGDLTFGIERQLQPARRPTASDRADCARACDAPALRPRPR